MKNVRMKKLFLFLLFLKIELFINVIKEWQFLVTWLRNIGKLYPFQV
nr:hypothetical protein WCOTENJF_WCOTENJF_CDS_0014 [uncultured phage]